MAPSQCEREVRSDVRWFPLALVATLALTLAPASAPAQRAPSYRVQHLIAVTVGPVVQASLESLPRELRDPDGTRWLAGTVRVSANVPCELRVMVAGGHTSLRVSPGVNSYAWRVAYSGDASTPVRLELVPEGVPVPLTL